MAYRGINPRWSFDPTSGEGAAIYGGRFNPKGVPALYLSLSPEGAFLEATQGFAYKFKPLTLCTYEVDCSDVADLSTEAGCRINKVFYRDLGSPWFLDMSEGRRPASWAIHDRLHGQFAGVIVPSFAVGAKPDMRNLVLWNWSDDLPHKVRVYDPEKRLPGKRPGT